MILAVEGLSRRRVFTRHIRAPWQGIRPAEPLGFPACVTAVHRPLRFAPLPLCRRDHREPYTVTGPTDRSRVRAATARPRSGGEGDTLGNRSSLYRRWRGRNGAVTQPPHLDRAMAAPRGRPDRYLSPVRPRPLTTGKASNPPYGVTAAGAAAAGGMAPFLPRFVTGQRAYGSAVCLTAKTALAHGVFLFWHCVQSVLAT